MTPRTSLRAAARDIYGELAKGQGAGPTRIPEPPHPSPLPDQGVYARLRRAMGEREQAERATGPDLTARVRALYEGSVVPVRAIAALAGVSERTIYKYVAKGGWTKRYRVMPRGEAAAAANRGRRIVPASGFTPARGAGGRFIGRADIPHDDLGKAFAQGLKATDPAGRVRAEAACAQAERLARLAQAQAQANRRHAALVRAIDGTARAFAMLGAIRKKATGRRRMAPTHVVLERVAIHHVEVALDSLRRISSEVTAG